MAEFGHFRSAFRGFNREDVVNYIEYLNNKHSAQLEQVNTQLQTALSQPKDDTLLARLQAAEDRCKELEEQLEAAGIRSTEQELEAYRRAERAERLAQERAQQIYDRANGILADATVKAESAAQQMDQLANQVADQLQAYQDSVATTKDVFQEAVSALYALRPEEQ